MNKDALIEAIANIDDEYILDAHAEASKTKRRARIIKIAAVAAAVCAMGAAIIVPAALRGNKPPVVTEADTDTDTDTDGDYSERISLNFSSYGELYESLSSADFCKKYIRSEDVNQYFKYFLDKTSKKEIELCVPVYNGEPADLKSMNDNLIILRSEEKFGLPWILYYCRINDVEVVFELCCLDVMNDREFDENATYSDISLQLAPKYVTASTFSDEHKTAYNSVIEKEIVLRDGTQVTATVFDYNEENYWRRKDYRFRFGNTIVSIWNCNAEDYESMNEEFISLLSFDVLQ